MQNLYTYKNIINNYVDNDTDIAAKFTSQWTQQV